MGPNSMAGWKGTFLGRKPHVEFTGTEITKHGVKDITSQTPAVLSSAGDPPLLSHPSV